MSRFAVVCFLAAVAGFLVSSCLEATQVTFDIKTDIPCDAIGRTAITSGLEGETEKASPIKVVKSCNANGTVGAVGTWAVHPKAGQIVVASFKVTVAVASSTDVESDCVPNKGYRGCVVSRRRIQFVVHRALRVPVDLLIRCKDVRCDENSTCNRLGRCVNSTVDVGQCDDQGNCSELISDPNDGVECFNAGAGQTLTCMGDRGWCVSQSDGTSACSGEPDVSGRSYQCRNARDCGPYLRCVSSTAIDGILGRCVVDVKDGDVLLCTPDDVVASCTATSRACFTDAGFGLLSCGGDAGIADAGCPVSYTGTRETGCVAIPPGPGGDLLVTAPFNVSTMPRAGDTSVVAPSLIVSGIAADTITTPSPLLGFSPGDEVMLVNVQGDPAAFEAVGRSETLFVNEVVDGGLQFRTPISGIYGRANANVDLTGQTVMALKVPHFDSVTVSDGGVLGVDPFGSGGNGVLALKAHTLTVTASGRIDVSARGYRAGGFVENGRHGNAGESISGSGTSIRGGPPNLGGGGGGRSDCDIYACTTQLLGAGGAGASYGGTGGSGLANGALHTGGQVGSPYGDSVLSRLFLGSGGGSGAGGYDGPSGPNTVGGLGGGLMLLSADNMNIAGEVRADGMTGTTNRNCGARGAGGGGGGSGGTVWLRARTLSLSARAVSAQGGAEQCNGGGAGGEGRIRFDFETLNGAPRSTASLNGLATPVPGFVGGAY